jgi:hypothetical protein
MWRGEVNDGVDATEFFWTQRGTRGVFRCTGDSRVMSALCRYFSDERSGFSAA